MPVKGSEEPVVVDGWGVFEEKNLKDKKSIVSRFEGRFIENVRDGFGTKSVYQFNSYPDLQW